MRQTKKHRWIIRGLVALLCIAAGSSVYFWNQSRTAAHQPAQESEAQTLVAAVSKLVVLPSDETPTIATVKDKESLKSQPFFIEAEVGDKVLIYQKAGKAILYRPSTNRVIAIAPFSSGYVP